MYSIINRFKDEASGWSRVAEDWPTFLYDEGAGWSQGDIRKGLFRGHVLVRVGPANSPHSSPSHLQTDNVHPQVALRIFRNTTAAHADKIGEWYNPEATAKARQGFVTRHNITKVTPQMVAYAAVQVLLLNVHNTPALTPLPASDICRTFLYEGVGRCRRFIQPHPPLPPRREDHLQHR
jgi:hypothetical protein